MFLLVLIIASEVSDPFGQYNLLGSVALVAGVLTFAAFPRWGFIAARRRTRNGGGPSDQPTVRVAVRHVEPLVPRD